MQYLKALDEKVSEREGEDLTRYLFHRMDADGSGKISVSELKLSLWGAASLKRTETFFLQDFVEEL